MEITVFTQGRGICLAEDDVAQLHRWHAGSLKMQKCTNQCTKKQTLLLIVWCGYANVMFWAILQGSKSKQFCILLQDIIYDCQRNQILHFTTVGF